jgi:hypothetical protein
MSQSYTLLDNHTLVGILQVELKLSLTPFKLFDLLLAFSDLSQLSRELLYGLRIPRT